MAEAARASAAVLVTGGAGFIGSHTCKALHAAGWTPIVYDNLVTGHRDAVRWGPFEQGDIRDTQRLADVMSRYRCDAVIHFAASAYVGESVRDPAKYYANNVVGTLSVLDAMRIAGLERIVFSSSCATYGVPATDLIDEATPQAPINPYGRSKWMCEQIIDDFVAAHGIGAVHLRYFNAAGNDPGLELGERHDPETHLVPLAVQAAAGLLPHIDIFGTDYPTPDGTCIRDYIHVCDLADAHVLGLSHCAAATRDAFNLGAGRGTSVRELVDVVSAVAGRETPVRTAPRRPGDPPMLVAKVSRARDVLGWSARRSDIRTVVQDAWNWATRDCR